MMARRAVATPRLQLAARFKRRDASRLFEGQRSPGSFQDPRHVLDPNKPTVLVVAWVRRLLKCGVQPVTHVYSIECLLSIRSAATSMSAFRETSPQQKELLRLELSGCSVSPERSSGLPEPQRDSESVSPDNLKPDPPAGLA